MPPIAPSPYFSQHGGDVPYVFGWNKLGSISIPDGAIGPASGYWDAAQQALSDKMVAYWANFVHHGTPNNQPAKTMSTPLNLSHWPAFNEDRMSMFLRDTGSKAAPNQKVACEVYDEFFNPEQIGQGSPFGMQYTPPLKKSEEL